MKNEKKPWLIYDGVHYVMTGLIETKATYRLGVGERSNGKTTQVLMRILERYKEKGKEGALIRRWADDLSVTDRKMMFDGIEKKGWISLLFEDMWDSVHYRAGEWFLQKHDPENKDLVAERAFMRFYALNTMEHNKGARNPYLGTIFFDEFMTRKSYLDDEFILFENVISSLVGDDGETDIDDLEIYMMANTVSKYCPYIEEMGLHRVRKQPIGTIDIYTYGEKKLTVAVEYTNTSAKGKKTDHLFAFDNPRLKMITSGSWEIGLYPRIPSGRKKDEVLFTYFLLWGGDIMQFDIRQSETDIYTFVHKKTSPIKAPEKEIIFSTEYNVKGNYFRKINGRESPLCAKLWAFFVRDKVFYATNQDGEIIREYLQWCNE